MTVGNRYRGNGLVVVWTTASGTTVITGDQTEMSPDRTADMVDISAGNDAAKSYLASLKDSKFTLKVFDTAAGGSAMMAQLIEGSAGTLSWGPQGSVAGKPKFAVGALVESLKSSIPFDKAVMMDIGFQGSGTFISDYGAVW